MLSVIFVTIMLRFYHVTLYACTVDYTIILSECVSYAWTVSY